MAGALAGLPTLESSHALLVLFFIMHMFGWIGSTIVLLTVLLANVPRHVTWKNLCISWIFACFSFSFLLLTRQLDNPAPNYSICLIQAAATFAAPTLTAGTTLALAIHLWINFRVAWGDGKKEAATSNPREVILNIVLATFPYLIPIAMYTSVFIYGYRHPERVALAGGKMYCSVNNATFGVATASMVTILMLPTLVFEGLLIASVYRNWHLYLRNLRNGLTTVIRLSAFTFFSLFGMAITLSYLSSSNYGRLPNVLMALSPVSFVLIFGFQMDILGALMLGKSPKKWRFWQQRKDNESFTSPQRSSAWSAREYIRRPDPVAVEVKYSQHTKVDLEVGYPSRHIVKF